jgi:hypothetical protein
VNVPAHNVIVYAPVARALRAYCFSPCFNLLGCPAVRLRFGVRLRLMLPAKVAVAQGGLIALHRPALGMKLLAAGEFQHLVAPLVFFRFPFHVNPPIVLPIRRLALALSHASDTVLVVISFCRLLACRIWLVPTNVERYFVLIWWEHIVSVCPALDASYLLTYAYAHDISDISAS